MNAPKTLTVNDAVIINKNFSGRISDFNRSGQMGFTLRIDDPETAQRLANDGWRVRPMNQKNPNDPRRWSLAVKVSYNDPRYIPIIRRFENGKGEYLNVNNIGQLDSDFIIKADVAIRPKYWEMNGKSGYTAVLQTMYCLAADDWDPETHKDDHNLVVRNANIIFRNFSGAKSQYNTSGERSFNLVIDDQETAERMISDGWHLKQRERSKDTQDNPYWTLPVALTFDKFPPNITYTIDGKTESIDETTVNSLDTARIEKMDIIIRPYNWHAGNKSGIKAYLKRMRVVGKKDEFADMYAQYEDQSDTQPSNEEDNTPW